MQADDWGAQESADLPTRNESFQPDGTALDIEDVKPDIHFGDADAEKVRTLTPTLTLTLTLNLFFSLSVSPSVPVSVCSLTV